MLLYAISAILSILVLCADRVVKYWVEANMALEEVRPLLPPVLELHAVHNYGAAWSLFSGARWVLVGVTAAMMLAVALSLILRLVRHPLGVVAAFLILAGGIGNLIDRIVLGYVVDMLRFPFWTSYPTFNVADVAVVTGCALWLLYILLIHEEPVEAGEPSEEGDAAPSETAENAESVPAPEPEPTPWPEATQEPASESVPEPPIAPPPAPEPPIVPVATSESPTVPDSAVPAVSEAEQRAIFNAAFPPADVPLTPGPTEPVSAEPVSVELVTMEPAVTAEEPAREKPAPEPATEPVEKPAAKPAAMESAPEPVEEPVEPVSAGRWESSVLDAHWEPVLTAGPGKRLKKTDGWHFRGSLRRTPAARDPHDDPEGRDSAENFFGASDED